jgi:hypothetical protein
MTASAPISSTSEFESLVLDAEGLANNYSQWVQQVVLLLHKKKMFFIVATEPSNCQRSKLEGLKRGNIKAFDEDSMKQLEALCWLQSTISDTLLHDAPQFCCAYDLWNYVVNMYEESQPSNEKRQLSSDNI